MAGAGGIAEAYHGTGGRGGDGGGIYCTGALVITGCTVELNETGAGANGRTGRSDGGAGGNGGGIWCSSVALTDSTIYENSSGQGGWSEFHGTAGGNGGGVYCSSASSNMVHCTITDNATGDGGYARGPTADGGDGGGICAPVSSAMTISNCTILSNCTGAGGHADSTYESCHFRKRWAWWGCVLCIGQHYGLHHCQQPDRCRSRWISEFGFVSWRGWWRWRGNLCLCRRCHTNVEYTSKPDRQWRPWLLK